MQVTNQTRLNMVIGYPLNHSASPILHNTVYQKLGINAVLLAAPHLELNALVQVIKTLDVELTAVTLPFKEKVLKYLDECSVEVKALMATNTILQRDGKLYGYNTDIYGIEMAFGKVLLFNKRVLVIGAGGAARAVGYFLKKNQAEVFWFNRTSKKAAELAKIFGGEVISYAALQAIDFDIIINTTPVGMYPNIADSPLPAYNFKEHQVVFDMVYNPTLTRLLKEAKDQKARIISGLDMFIGQGLKQIELLTGRSICTSYLINFLKKTLTDPQKVG